MVMLATYVEARRTPFTFNELAVCLENGLASVLGRKPSRATLSVALAKVRLESGNGEHCWNFNLGNVKCPEDVGGMYTAITLNEVLQDNVVWFSPRGRLSGKGGPVIAEWWDDEPWHPQTRMRALAGPTDAGYFYVDFVAKRTRYAKAWQALLAGNAEAYARELGAAGYYTAPIAAYTAQVVKLAEQSARKLADLPHEEIVVPERWDWVAELQGQAWDRTLDMIGTPGRNLLEYEQAGLVDEDSGGGTGSNT